LLKTKQIIILFAYHNIVDNLSYITNVVKCLIL